MNVQLLMHGHVLTISFIDAYTLFNKLIAGVLRVYKDLLFDYFSEALVHLVMLSYWILILLNIKHG